ncbi:MAG TPA: SbcC/MukB-like Walker B domain-containing protein [Rectinemataceae bacterium]|nr:SbcC/MukB-like Walker B domain-containing protein [Rectinemataceae bacterium]
MSEFELAEGRGGFRLEGMELFNWGTFGKAVWPFPFGGENALVTGDIGSGKSTWVDAITTLLVPPQRITYNKAAGAERRERTDKSYVLGEYRTSRGEGASFAAPVTLRDEKSYSVILAVFADRRGSRLLSLAQVRWIKAGEVQRLYVSSGRRLSVLADFGSFDGDGSSLRKRLRASPSTEVFDSYADYGAAFRSSMGITEKALDLFNQTVSMKTIGDLDDFIRSHMLEATGARDRLDRMLRNFDNLRAAHDAVENSRKQRDALLPIAAENREHTGLVASIEELRAMAMALPFRVIGLEIPLLEREIERLGLELEARRAALDALRSTIAQRRETQASLRSAIDNSEAGRRIRELEAEMERVADERDRRRHVSASYRIVLDRLGLAMPVSAETMVSLRAALDTEQGRIAAEVGRLSEERDGRVLERSERERELRDIEAELSSLKGRTTSIPARSAELRRELAEAVGATETELPFAGELVRVRVAEKKWEGAAERVLRSFALSVLVPERHYRAVSEYVRATRLDARLVYFRVAEGREQAPRLAEGSLARVLEVKPEAPFRAWLESELARRADYIRCEDMERFYREPEAVTAEGLVKSGRIRHEKDDRKSVADPRNFVLGWSNADKIALLERDRAGARKALDEALRLLALSRERMESLESRRSDVAEALRLDSFDELDLESSVERYRLLRAERETLEESSDQLARLKAAMDEVGIELARLEAEANSRTETIGGLKNEGERREGELDRARNNAGSPAAKEAAPWFGRIDAFAGASRPDLDGLHAWRGEILRRLEARRATQERKDSDLRSSLLKRMHEFLSSFPDRGAELSVGVEFATDYASLLARIEGDDLPSYEGRFRSLLRESTLRDIALFHTELDNDTKAIKEAIAIINGSLAGISYNQGSYISLAAERTDDQTVRDFRSELRRCLENQGGDEELYSEERFVRVKNLLARLAGSEPADRAWTEHVIDARSWFTFTATERWLEDDTEREFYSSSSGKSGGQKEKLAYTILASALAYQYGQGVKRDGKGFRLVVIDEAFGRGSEESTKYGLRLFESLDLQLVLVTPLMKIGVIEGSVATIHFIANPGGSASEVRNIAIRDYETTKAALASENAKAEPVVEASKAEAPS